jgi:integrase
MPRIRIPKFCRHKATGQAYIQLPGSKKQIYLGAYGTPAADAEYRRIIAELAADPTTDFRDAATGRAFTDVTVNELALAYLDHCDTYYAGPDGKPSREVVNIELALRSFRKLYGRTPVREMGPRWLKTLQHALVEHGLTRREINKRVGKVKRMIKWATAEELAPSSIFHALQAVEGLRRGRSGAKEHEPVRPVPDAHVDAVKPYVSRQVWAMIELQRLTGMRPGEVALMRTGDIDRSSMAWTYQPSRHKTSFHGHERKVFLGPKAQAILQSWLRADPDAFLFQPVEAEAERNAARSANRKTPMTPSHRKRKPKAVPKRSKRECYDVASYRRAIKYGCKRATVPNWHPHQLRHNAATALRKEFGVDVAGVILGHRQLAVTQIYAERDEAKAAEVISKVG